MHVSRAVATALPAAALAVTSCTAAAPVFAQSTDRLDQQMLGCIRDDRMYRSHVMDIISWRSDVRGTRLTGSPGVREAGDWTIGTVKM